jgi:hypothetical protein
MERGLSTLAKPEPLRWLFVPVFFMPLMAFGKMLIRYV